MDSDNGIKARGLNDLKIFWHVVKDLLCALAIHLLLTYCICVTSKYHSITSSSEKKLHAENPGNLNGLVL